jgi:very-short-patch-repair endonuclease
LNVNVTRKVTQGELENLRVHAATASTNLMTTLYCIKHKIQCKKCLTCGAELNVDNFQAGWGEIKKFCSIKCKAEYTPAHSQSEEIFTDYKQLLDKNGNIAHEKVNANMNPASFAHLKAVAGVDCDHLNTNVFLALKMGQPKFCVVCNAVLHVGSLGKGYRKNQNYCSYDCKDIHSVYRDSLKVGKAGVCRYDNAKYYETRNAWFDDKVANIRERFGTQITTTYDEYIADKRNLKYTCLTCDHHFVNDMYFYRNLFCTICHPTSKEQAEITKFVSDLGFTDITCNTRKVITPYEIDIFVGSKNIGIEYDGFYWHNDKNDSKKLKLAKDKGVRIIKVFEDELRNSRDIVFSKIKSVIGKTENRIFARKCSVKPISYDEAKQFLLKTHIQGSVPASICYGLFSDAELVAVMTFGKSRYNKNYEWELLRFSTKLNHQIVGGASKLLKQFRRDHAGSLISYCDLRYGSGGMYEKLGFKFSHTSDPNYFYYRGGERYSRIKFQKHKLAAILKNYDPELSESENMMNNGYMKIWDAGNNVYILD